MAVTPEERAMVVSQDAWGRIIALLAAADGDIAGAEDALAAALESNDLPPGDFVRHCRQVIDLLDQLTADERLGRTARAAIDGVRRGLVAQEIGR